MSPFARRLQRASNSAASELPQDSDLSLPRIAWEGGSAYWAQYSKADAAGWSDPSFFPMMSFSNSFSSKAEIRWDKDHGINVYHGLNPYSEYTMLNGEGMYYVGTPYADVYSNTVMPSNFASWVGHNTDDEVDGTSGSGPAGLALVTTATNNYRALNDGRFICSNFTQMVVSTGFQSYGAQYINHAGVDAVSIDMYWYTIPNSSFNNTYVSSVGGPANPRSATSYGAMVRGLRQQNDLGPTKKPMWMFVEVLSGSPGEQFVRYIDPGELKGAVMSSIINEARGIMWFNNVASAGKSIGNVLRQAQVSGSGFVGAAQITAMKEVNTQVHALASVINTQSYVWSFGSNLETMLKTSGGYAYIFAMGSNNSTPGSRTFTLPTGINGASVQVVDEDRTLTVNGAKQFSDSFTAEYSYHIYKVSLT